MNKTQQQQLDSHKNKANKTHIFQMLHDELHLFNLCGSFLMKNYN